MTVLKNDQKLIWDYFQDENMDFFASALPRYNFLIRRIKRKVKPQSNFLNIGIGSGEIEINLFNSGYNVFALDPSENSVKALKNKSINAKVGKVEKIPYEDNKFDCILLSEVIEHIPTVNLFKSIEEITRVLKPNGILITTVPFNEILIDNRCVCPNCGSQFHRWGHHNSFNIETFSNLFRNDYNIKQIKIMAFIDWKFKFSSIIKNLVKFILGKMGKQITSPRIFMIAQKKSTK